MSSSPIVMKFRASASGAGFIEVMLKGEGIGAIEPELQIGRGPEASREYLDVQGWTQKAVWVTPSRHKGADHELLVLLAPPLSLHLKAKSRFVIACTVRDRNASDKIWEAAANFAPADFDWPDASSIDGGIAKTRDAAQTPPPPPPPRPTPGTRPPGVPPVLPGGGTAIQTPPSGTVGMPPSGSQAKGNAGVGDTAERKSPPIALLAGAAVLTLVLVAGAIWYFSKDPVTADEPTTSAGGLSAEEARCRTPDGYRSCENAATDVEFERWEVFSKQNRTDIGVLFLQRAADAGHAGAAFTLAEMFDPVRFDAQTSALSAASLTEAHRYYRMAEAGGDANARTRLTELKAYAETEAAEGNAEASQVLKEWGAQ